MKLRAPLFMFYLCSMDLHNCQKMVTWFYENKNLLSSKITQNNQLFRAYIEYLKLATTYEFFQKKNLARAQQNLLEAHKLLEHDDMPENKLIKFGIYNHLAQYYTHIGDFALSAKYIAESKNLLSDIKMPLYSIMYYWNLAYYNLFKGNYAIALDHIEKTNIILQEIPYDSMFAIYQLLYAKMLRLNGNLTQAKEIIDNIYANDHILLKGSKGHLFTPEIFLELTRVNIALGNLPEAEQFNSRSFDIYGDNSLSNISKLLKHDNLDIAYALLNKAKICRLRHKPKQAKKYLAYAKTIALNKYKKANQIPQYIQDLLDEKI